MVVTTTPGSDPQVEVTGQRRFVSRHRPEYADVGRAVVLGEFQDGRPILSNDRLDPKTAAVRGDPKPGLSKVVGLTLGADLYSPMSRKPVVAAPITVSGGLADSHRRT